MQRLRSIIQTGLLLLTVGLFFLPAGSQAQCMTSITSSGSYSTGGMVVKYIYKSIGGNYTCNLTMSMNVIDCNPATGGLTSILTATAYTAATNPSCGWNCGCGPVTITGADGLPVELMDFAVEGTDD